MNTDSKFARIGCTRVKIFRSSYFVYSYTDSVLLIRISNLRPKLKTKNSIRLWTTSVRYPEDHCRHRLSSHSKRIGRRRSRGEIVLNFEAIRKRFGTIRCTHYSPDRNSYCRPVGRVGNEVFARVCAGFRFASAASADNTDETRRRRTPLLPAGSR